MLACLMLLVAVAPAADTPSAAPAAPMVDSAPAAEAAPLPRAPGACDAPDAAAVAARVLGGPDALQ
ncbi:MAG: hypothetical protein ACK4YP_08460, partial [Myxococcota bacterium]